MARKPKNRVNVYIRSDKLGIASQIENFSAFLDICLEQAPDIMAWAILNRADPKKYHARAKIEDVVGEFNEKFPMDPNNPLTEVTQKRQGVWPKNSPKKPELW